MWWTCDCIIADWNQLSCAAAIFQSTYLTRQPSKDFINGHRTMDHHWNERQSSDHTNIYTWPRVWSRELGPFLFENKRAPPHVTPRHWNGTQWKTTGETFLSRILVRIDKTAGPSDIEFDCFGTDMNSLWQYFVYWLPFRCRQRTRRWGG